MKLLLPTLTSQSYMHVKEFLYIFRIVREKENLGYLQDFVFIYSAVFSVVICFEYHSIIILYYDFRGICAIHPKVALFLTFTYFWMHPCTRVCARRGRLCVTPAVSV